MSGTLYVVGTPIGNLSDASPRMVETLRQVDFVAAEDTRVSGKLLRYFNISKPQVSYFEHNRNTQGQAILKRLMDGESAAIVTDAGMPAISDPGEDLVRECHIHQVPVVVVPGPCACVSALALSGLPTARFAFEGFLSMTRNSRRAHLESLKADTHTLIFYEAPHKLIGTLNDLYEAFGDRPIALVREMTKCYEETTVTTLAKAVALYDEENKPRGEFVLVVGGATPPAPPEHTLDEWAALALERQAEGLRGVEAAKQLAKESGIPKSELYAAMQRLERLQDTSQDES